MSRYYRMSLTVEAYAPQHRETLQAALQECWGFGDFYEHEGTLSACAENWLCGGETENQFAERLARLVWQANDAFCQVQVEAICLENLPCEEFAFDESSYRRLVPTGVARKTDSS